MAYSKYEKFPWDTLIADDPMSSVGSLRWQYKGQDASYRTISVHRVVAIDRPKIGDRLIHDTPDDIRHLRKWVLVAHIQPVDDYARRNTLWTVQLVNEMGKKIDQVTARSEVAAVCALRLLLEDV